jgi:hypothetical protein
MASIQFSPAVFVKNLLKFPERFADFTVIAFILGLAKNTLKTVDDDTQPSRSLHPMIATPIESSLAAQKAFLPRLKQS